MIKRVTLRQHWNGQNQFREPAGTNSEIITNFLYEVEFWFQIILRYSTESVSKNIRQIRNWQTTEIQATFITINAWIIKAGLPRKICTVSINVWFHNYFVRTDAYCPQMRCDQAADWSFKFSWTFKTSFKRGYQHDTVQGRTNKEKYGIFCVR